jgi:hypothetical protein
MVAMLRCHVAALLMHRFSRQVLARKHCVLPHVEAVATPDQATREPHMLKFIGGTIGFIFLIGLLVVIGLLMLIF